MVTINMKSSNKRQFVNISKAMHGTLSVICFAETNFDNSQYIIENYSKNISMKFYQSNFGEDYQFLDINSKSMFSFNDYILNRIICIEFYVGKLNEHPTFPK